jgi:hypothetical protein
MSAAREGGDILENNSEVTAVTENICPVVEPVLDPMESILFFYLCSLICCCPRQITT